MYSMYRYGTTYPFIKKGYLDTSHQSPSSTFSPKPSLWASLSYIVPLSVGDTSCLIAAELVCARPGRPICGCSRLTSSYGRANFYITT